MRVSDEYKIDEFCLFKIDLESYKSKFPDLNDYNSINIKEKKYSKRLYFHDKCSIIYSNYHQEELTFDDFLYNIETNECINDKFNLYDIVQIKIFENNTLIQELTL